MGSLLEERRHTSGGWPYPTKPEDSHWSPKTDRVSILMRPETVRNVPYLINNRGMTNRLNRTRIRTNSTENLRQRLANANDYFHRKASEVFSDEAALEFLAVLYRDVVVEIKNFDSCKSGISLAKLTAANFAEIGANVIYITEAGQKFIESIEEAWVEMKSP